VRTWADCGDAGLGIGGKRDSCEAIEGLTENGRTPVTAGPEAALVASLVQRVAEGDALEKEES